LTVTIARGVTVPSWSNVTGMSPFSTGTATTGTGAPDGKRPAFFGCSTVREKYQTAAPTIAMISKNQRKGRTREPRLGLESISAGGTG